MGEKRENNAILQEEKFSESIQREYEDYKKSISAPNILIMGGTGVGKSSLINRIFGAEIARQGVGRPITQELDRYANENVPVVLYDSKGYEIGEGKEDEFLANIVKYIEGENNGDDRIHLAWYCVQSSAHRITDFDIKTVRKLQELKIPLAIVLTKADLVSESASQELKKTIHAELGDTPVFEVSSTTDIPDLQPDGLCEWAINMLPEGERRAFIAAQRVSMQQKRKECQKVIAQHVATAGVIPMNPVPVSDGPLLMVNQTTMIARIMHIYNMGSLLENGGKSALISSLIGPVIVRSGVMAAASLLKLIPGAGTTAAAVINIGVATSITWAVGAATIEMCERLLMGMLEGGRSEFDDVLSQAANIFKMAFNSEMSKKR